MMNYRIMLRRAGLTALPALLLVIGLACERSDKPSETGSTTLAPFTPPEIDLEPLPPKLKERVTKLLELIQQTPAAADPVGALGAIYYVYGQPAAAAQCFAQAGKAAPETMHWRYYEGLAAEGAGLSEAAVKAFEKALELDANYLHAYVRLAGLLIESDRERAERLLRRALELNPRDALAIQTLGRCLEASGDSAGALRQYQEALTISPNYADAHEGAARVYAAMGRDAEAEKHKQLGTGGNVPIGDDFLLTLLYRQGFHLDALLHFAAAAAERGRFSEADQSLLQATEADLEGVATHEVTAYVRMLEERYEEAAAEYLAALELKPEMIELRARLADVLARQEKFSEAEAEFCKVLESDPDDAFALERYSRLLMVERRAEEAEKLLRDAVARRPNEAWLYLQLGTVLFHAGKDDDAVEALKKCLASAPDTVEGLYTLGLAEQRRGNEGEALKHWGRVVELVPGYIDAHLRLASSAIQHKDLKAAERYLREALAHNPDYASFNNSLAWLLATSPDDAQRNGAEALRLAEKACRTTENKQHVYLDTLAAAQAEQGLFEEAASTMQNALELAQQENNAATIEAYERRLELYQRKEPYREGR